MLTRSEEEGPESEEIKKLTVVMVQSMDKIKVATLRMERNRRESYC